MRRTRRISANSAGLKSSIEYATTTAASAACGMSPISGASRSSVASAVAAVTRPATWVFAPARRFTAVCDAPPPAGIAPSRPPAALASAGRDQLAVRRGRGSPGAANARPTAMVSVKLMSAMPAAAGHICSDEIEIGQHERRQLLRHRADRGHAGLAQPERAEAAIARPIATSGTGQPRRVALEHEDQREEEERERRA